MSDTCERGWVQNIPNKAELEEDGKERREGDSEQRTVEI